MTQTATKARATPAKGVVKGILGAGMDSPPDLFSAVNEGLAVSELDDLQEAAGVTRETLAEMIGVSKATLARRRPGQTLSRDESDRIVRFARLVAIAQSVMGSADHARRWLKSPQMGLGGATPLQFALTEVGAREVENLLGRIEYGVYS